MERILFRVMSVREQRAETVYLVVNGRVSATGIGNWVGSTLWGYSTGLFLLVGVCEKGTDVFYFFSRHSNNSCGRTESSTFLSHHQDFQTFQLPQPTTIVPPRSCVSCSISSWGCSLIVRKPLIQRVFLCACAPKPFVPGNCAAHQIAANCIQPSPCAR